MDGLRSPGSNDPGGPRHRDVVVVGAGLAGLAAAHALVAEGLDVVVLEARGRVGGRAHSLEVGEAAVDLGASWCWPHEPRVHALAADLAVGTFPQWRDGDALFEPDRRGVQRLRGNPVDVPSSRFVRGAQELALRLAARLPPGTVRLHDPVSAVSLDAGGVRVDAAGGPTAASQVVLALPPSLAVEAIAFTPALPEQVRRVAEATAVWMGGVVKAVAVYDRASWRDAGLAGAAVSHLGPFRELHDHSGPDGAPAALFGFAAAEQLRGVGEQQVAAALVQQLRRTFGEAAAAPRQVLVADWSRETRTSPRAPSPHAGTSTYGHPLLQQAVGGRLHWASTETSSEHPGHLEGALQAGARAAAAAAAGARAPARGPGG